MVGNLGGIRSSPPMTLSSAQFADTPNGCLHCSSTCREAVRRMVHGKNCSPESSAGSAEHLWVADKSLYIPQCSGSSRLPAPDRTAVVVMTSLWQSKTYYNPVSTSRVTLASAVIAMCQMKMHHDNLICWKLWEGWGKLFSVCFNATSLEKRKSSLSHSCLQRWCRW